MSDKSKNFIYACIIIIFVGMVVSIVSTELRGGREMVADVGKTDYVDVSGHQGTTDVTVSMQENEKSSSTATAQQQALTTGLYYYESLTQDEKAMYQQIYSAITTREKILLDTVNDGVVDKVFQSIMNDHPEIFYSSAYQLEKQMRDYVTVKMYFQPTYHMTEEEQKANQYEIERYVQACISAMPQGLDDYGKVKYVYEYIIRNTEYELNCENSQNICSVFLNGKSVCQGYAKATQYILSKMGFEITLAYGTVGTDLHSWNLIRVDGDYYYMDTTWGDAGYSRPGTEQQVLAQQVVNYEYFLITTQQISRTHRIDNVVSLPACIATRNNYFVREGRYLTSADESAVRAVVEFARTASPNEISFMCSDAMVYEEVKNMLITRQKLFDFVPSSNSVSYSYNDNMYTLIFWIE